MAGVAQVLWIDPVVGQLESQVAGDIDERLLRGKSEGCRLPAYAGSQRRQAPADRLVDLGEDVVARLTGEILG